jgi:Sulfotransferase domain
VTPTTTREGAAGAGALESAGAPPRLPERAILLHVGPHKTGTTAIQAAFRIAGAALAEHGVRYVGSRRHRVDAAQAVRSADPKPSDGHGLRQWRALVDEARTAADARVVISSEWLSEATPEAIPRIVQDLGVDRVHVVVTLRSLMSILPSQWQQYVQGNVTLAYHDWLDAVLRQPDRRVTPSFWQRHRHDQLIARWAEVVGSDRVTAVVADERDPGFVLRTFESLVGLPDGTLQLHEDRSNRSLTWPEIEVVRRIQGVLDELGVDGPLRQGLVLYGAAPAMKERVPLPGEPRIETPAWAVDEAVRIGSEMAEAIAASGVQVVGDLTRLATAPERRPAAPTPPEAWPDIAAHAVRGVLRRSGVLPDSAASDASKPRLTRVSTKRLIGILARRLQRAATRRLARA